MAEEALDDAGVIIPEENGTPEIQPNSEQEDTVALQEKLDSALKAKSDLTARAKKAEEELKALKANPPVTNNPQLSDELKLIARGLSDEEIEQAKIIARGKNIVLTEAIKDPLFLVYQSDLKEKERKEKAKLGASKGSGETEVEITGLEAGSSREEHKKAFDKLVGKS